MAGLARIGWVVLLFGLSGCSTPFMQPAEHVLEAPPEGKVLVNVHRPSGEVDDGYVASVNHWYPIFDGNEFIGANRRGQLFQYVCDPGEHVFVGRHSCLGVPSDVSVVEAELRADKVYDLLVYTRANVTTHRMTLLPIPAGDLSRSDAARWQLDEIKMNLLRSAEVLEFEDRWQKENQREIANCDERRTLGSNAHR